MPLTGLVAVALLFAGLLLGSDAPDTGDGGRKILDFYVANDSEQTASAILLAYGCAGPGVMARRVWG
ncbi:MAG: hypothetical protein ABI726_05165 [bacterium]